MVDYCSEQADTSFIIINGDPIPFSSQFAITPRIGSLCDLAISDIRSLDIVVLVRPFGLFLYTLGGCNVRPQRKLRVERYLRLRPEPRQRGARRGHLFIQVIGWSGAKERMQSDDIIFT